MFPRRTGRRSDPQKVLRQIVPYRAPEQTGSSPALRISPFQVPAGPLTEVLQEKVPVIVPIRHVFHPRQNPAAASSLISPPPNAPSTKRFARYMGSAVQKIPMSRAVNGISGSVNTESPARIISGTSTRSGIIIVRISVHAIWIRTTARHQIPYKISSFPPSFVKIFFEIFCQKAKRRSCPLHRIKKPYFMSPFYGIS